MVKDGFFDEPTEQSKAKVAIVTKYFTAWSRVMISIAKKAGHDIQYVDLFAGPGNYRDGSKSTPVEILERAIQNPDLRQRLIMLFNDANPASATCLEQVISKMPGIETMKFKPKVFSESIDDQIVQVFKERCLIPTLLFADPWGYKGVSLELINSVIKDWGCDCIFFFNYRRINMALNNDKFEENMNLFFGKAKAEKLRECIKGVSPSIRESIVIEGLVQALIERGGSFVLPFRFKTDSGKCTSHHLVFVSKGLKGYEIMKEIMAGESSKADQGVPSFEYSPADSRTPLLFELSRPLDDLRGMLTVEFAGRKLTVRKIFEEHNIGRPFILRNYKAVLKEMENKGRITISPPASERRKIKGVVTLADDAVVTFPEKSK